MLRKISIQKIDNATGKMPTHRLVASDDNYENKTIVGAFWTKENEHGKFLSGELQKESEKYDGYVIITEKEYRELKRSNEDKVASTIPPTPGDINF